MFSDDLIGEIADDLERVGRCLVFDQDYRRLLVVRSDYLDISGAPELLLAYEGRGAIFFTIDRPMNHFRLLSHGFPEIAAHSVSDMVNRLITVLADRRRVEATNVALEGKDSV
jgi:hypothetical protein